MYGSIFKFIFHIISLFIIFSFVQMCLIRPLIRPCRIRVNEVKLYIIVKCQDLVGLSNLLKEIEDSEVNCQLKQHTRSQQFNSCHHALIIYDTCQLS